VVKADADKSLDNVSRITSDTTDAGPATEWDTDEECAATTLGNLDIVLRILSEMCDGQYTDLQASYTNQTIDWLIDKQLR